MRAAPLLAALLLGPALASADEAAPGAAGLGWFRNAGGGMSLSQDGSEFLALGRPGRYPEANSLLEDRFLPGILLRQGGLYVYADTRGTFGQAAAAAIIANSTGAGMPQISGYVTAADAGAGGERGSAGLYIENNAPSTLDVEGVTFDRTHLFLPASRPLSPAEVKRYGQPGTFIEAFTRGKGVGPFTGQVTGVSADGMVVTMTGWWLQGDAAPGQHPTIPAGAPAPYAAHLGVVAQIWGQNTNVALTPSSRARSAFVYEGGAFNNTGAFAPGALSNPMADVPFIAGFQVANGNGGAAAGTSSAFWAFGKNWRRGFTASGIAEGGAGFVFGDTTGAATALYSAQTAGQFLRLAPGDGAPVFSVDALGSLVANQVVTRGPLRLGRCPASAAGLSSGDLWCNGTVVNRVP